MNENKKMEDEKIDLYLSISCWILAVIVAIVGYYLIGWFAFVIAMALARTPFLVARDKAKKEGQKGNNKS